jgi:lipopolysaccharide transport system permease protein
MNTYLGEIWKCRYFWLSLVKMDLRSRYRGTVLGIGWSLLQPIAMTTIFCLVFRVWMKADLRYYAPYVFTGMTFWGYFSAVVLQGCQCFFQGESYIRQFPAPMAIYPLRTMLGSAFHFSIGLLLALALAFWNGPPIEAHSSCVMQLLALPSLILTFGLLLVFGWSVAVLFGLFNVRFRDTRHLTEVALQLLFYMMPIMYDFSDLGPRNRLVTVLQCNPLVPFLDLLREPILYGHFPTPMMYVNAAAVVLILAGLAVYALWIEERRLIFHL